MFVERALHCHRSQINSAEFLNGVRTVLKRDNVVEAISICDATPGPVARIVKTAILNRDKGRERVREAVEEAGLTEVPQLEERLNLLATIAQIAPLLGLLGTILGFMNIFQGLQKDGLYAHISGDDDSLSWGIWQALICAAAGIAVAIPVHAGYNYLVSRINKIVARHGTRRRRNRQHRHRKWRRQDPMKFPRNAKILRSPFEVAPFAAVFFLLVMFLLLGALLPVQGLRTQLTPPAADNLPGVDGPTVGVAVDAGGRLYFANQIVTNELQLNSGLSNAVKHARAPLTLVIHADKTVTEEQLLHLALLARTAGITNALLATLPRVSNAPVRP